MAGNHDDDTSEASLALLDQPAGSAEAAPVARSLDLIRPDARLRLHVSLIGGKVDPVSNRISLVPGAEAIYLVLSFGSQHTVEPTSIDGLAIAGASPQRIAAPSRLAFEVEPDTPFALDPLLRLATRTLSLDSRADRRWSPGRDTRFGEPGPAETAIEIPAGLILSPTPGSTFLAEPPAAPVDGITERWGARLARPRRDASGRLRAVHVRSGDPAWPVPLDEADRNLVADATKTEPLAAARLILTADGADVDLSGRWDHGLLAGYLHRAASGRDLEVVKVERGYLAPFGHGATLTTITERRTVPDGDRIPTSGLFSETYLTITDQAVTGATPHTPAGGRALPFTSIDAADGGSAPVASRPIEQRNDTTLPDDEAAILTRNGRDIRIDYRATDRDGNDGIAFDLPAVFVFEHVAYEPRDDDGSGNGRTTLSRLARWFRSHPAMSTADLDGQPVAWAEPPADRGAAEAGSVQDTEWIRFRLDRPDVDAGNPADVDRVATSLEALGRPAFDAAVLKASVVDRSSATVAGVTSPSVEVEVAERYLLDGTGPGNPDLGYLDLVDLDDGNQAETVPSTDADGILQLGVLVETFGQSLGAAALEVLEDWWDPAEALAGLPKLLGAIDLTALLPQVDMSEVFGSGNGGGGGAGNGPALPTIDVELIDGDGTLSIPEGVCIELAWAPKLQSFPTGENAAKTFVVAADHRNDGDDPHLPLAADAFGTDDDTRANFSITTCIPGNTTVDVSLDRFSLKLPPAFPVIAVMFDRVAVLDVSGSATLDTKLADWLFIGALNWLEPIKDLLLDGLGLGVGGPGDDGDGGFGIDVDIPIPAIQLGIVGISGIQLGMALDLPTDGPSQVGFNLSAREDPFTLTLFGIGGIGHFVVEVDANRIVRIEASLGVTYETAIDVFVVSAAVSISVGAWVEIRFNPDKTEEVIFGAYAEVGAAASLLGLVEISGTVTVGLTYRPGPKRLNGFARVTGEVESIFGGGTASHDVGIEIDLGDDQNHTAAMAPGEQPTLTFGDRYDDDQWNDYCDAFVAA